MAIAQKDFKRMIAYSSMAHVGLIATGVFSMNLVALQGATYQMLSHGINAVGLFFIAEVLHRRMKKRHMDEMGGIAHASPIFAVTFMVILLGSVALPLTNGFIGEFLLLTGIYQSHPWLTAFAGLSVILGAVYMLRAYQRVMLGGETDASSAFFTLTFQEKSLLAIIVVVVLVMGIYPKPLLDIAEPSLRALLSHAGMSI
jgi:NADH-quinone oxidoreductase subunit M